MVFRDLKIFAAGMVGLALFSSPAMAQEKTADDGNLPETGETGASTEEQAEQDARDEEWLREHERMVREKNYERWVHWLGEADYDFLERMGADRISYLIQAFRETSDRERIEEIERDFGDERGYCGFLREQTEEAREWLAHLDQLTAERGSREAAARDNAYETLKELIAKYDEHLEADCD